MGVKTNLLRVISQRVLDSLLKGQGAGLRFQISDFRDHVSGFRVQVSGFEVQGVWPRVWALGSRVKDDRPQRCARPLNPVQGSGCMVRGYGFRMYCLG